MSEETVIYLKELNAAAYASAAAEVRVCLSVCLRVCVCESE